MYTGTLWLEQLATMLAHCPSALPPHTPLLPLVQRVKEGTGSISSLPFNRPATKSESYKSECDLDLHGKAGLQCKWDSRVHAHSANL